jgi:hypothetical protein
MYICQNNLITNINTVRLSTVFLVMNHKHPPVFWNLLLLILVFYACGILTACLLITLISEL